MSECAWSDHTAVQAHCIHLNPWVQNQAVHKAAEYSGQSHFRELNKFTHSLVVNKSNGRIQ